MIQLTVHNEVSDALARTVTELENTLVETVNDIRDLWALRAVTNYMRDARGEQSPSGRPLPRSPFDSGPLRILRGRLATSILGRLAGTENIEAKYELTRSTDEVFLRWGSITPYANIHERGGMSGLGLRTRTPARPYIQPAQVDIESSAARIADENLSELIQRVGLR